MVPAVAWRRGDDGGLVMTVRILPLPLGLIPPTARVTPPSGCGMEQRHIPTHHTPPIALHWADTERPNSGWGSLTAGFGGGGGEAGQDPDAKLCTGVRYGGGLDNKWSTVRGTWAMGPDSPFPENSGDPCALLQTAPPLPQGVTHHHRSTPHQRTTDLSDAKRH